MPAAAWNMSDNLIRNFINEFFGLFPSEAWIGYRLTVDSSVCFLITINDVAFYHKAFAESAKLGILAH